MRRFGCTSNDHFHSQLDLTVRDGCPHDDTILAPRAMKSHELAAQELLPRASYSIQAGCEYPCSRIKHGMGLKVEISVFCRPRWLQADQDDSVTPNLSQPIDFSASLVLQPSPRSRTG